MINQVIGQRYEILEKVGEGPLFAAYKARDTAMNRVVAVKVLHSQFLGDATLRGSLRAALNETVALNHAGITRFYEYREESELCYLVTEFVRGIDLKERIRRIAPFTLSLVVDFGCSIAEALHYAHSTGQTHGDLRPQNIIVSPEGVVKVSGFGIQKAISRCPAAQVALLSQSAPYHAPELSTTGPGTVQGDVYAMGAILHEMLTGVTLYAGATPEEQSDAHALAPIPSARVINPGVPRQMEAILLKCLEKKPADRYNSVAELLAELKGMRDALRFGRPLTSGTSATEASRTNQPASAVSGIERPTAAPNRPSAPETPTIPTERNRLRAREEKVSVYIKVAIGTVTVIILVCFFWLYGIYLSLKFVPAAVDVPQIVGKTIEDVRKIAAEKKFKLIEHAEYNDNARGIVYQTDQEKNARLRPGRSINVWFSRGSEYVNVPNVVNMSREEAEQKLKDAGLKVGRVTPEYNDHIAENVVINQDVTFKKRVFHDTVVSLTVSNGPDPASPHASDTPPGGAPDGSTTENPPTTNPDGGNAGDGTHAPDNGAADTEQHSFSRYIGINRDGRGRRRVRVEFSDATGTHPPVIDEGHDEGDRIQIKFDYTGKTIVLKVYYDDVLKSSWTLSPDTSRKTTN